MLCPVSFCAAGSPARRRGSGRPPTPHHQRGGAGYPYTPTEGVKNRDIPDMVFNGFPALVTSSSGAGYLCMLIYAYVWHAIAYLCSPQRWLLCMHSHAFAYVRMRSHYCPSGTDPAHTPPPHATTSPRAVQAQPDNKYFLLSMQIIIFILLLLCVVGEYPR